VEHLLNDIRLMSCVERKVRHWNIRVKVKVNNA
jgi:hypothetical protein